MLGVALVMLVVGVRLNLLTLPEVTRRCGACGRITRRGSVCRCARPDADER
jgi:hypothetical protein